MEVTIGSKVYRTGKLDAFQQFHVSRRIVPAIAGLAASAATLIPLIEKMEGMLDDDLPKALSDPSLVKGMMPLADAIASMKEEDCDYVLKACLSVCERSEPAGAWGKVMVKGQLMYQIGDGAIGMKEMIQLTMAVIKENLSNFFPTAQPEK